jgi:cell division protein FtsB
LQIKSTVRRIVFLILFVLVGAYGYLALRGPQGIPALRQKWSEIRKLEEENAALQRENDYRRSRIKKLQDNSSEQELEIRKKLKLLRPGETSFILPYQPPRAEKPHDDSPAPPPSPAQD